MIGYIAYPKLGHPSPYSSPMQLEGQQIPNRYQVLGIDPPANAGGETISNKMPSGKPVPDHKQKFTSMVSAPHKNLVANMSHESQHSIFSKISQQHGSDFSKHLIQKTLGILEPYERKALSHLNIHNASYAPEEQAEESIAYAHNYLTDPQYRERVHKKHNLSPKASRQLQGIAKNIFKKLRNHAATLDYPTVQKSLNLDVIEERLEKRGVPVFPKLGVPDKRNEVESINDPKKLYTKLSVMAHAGAKKKSANSHYKDPASKASYHTDAKREAVKTYQAAKQGTTRISGAVSTVNNVGYALSGVLRPAMWQHPIENESHGTKQHEEFHSQLNRVEQKHGRIARTALADNLWNALPQEQQHALNYLQNHWAGDSYEKLSPGMVTEEKIARLFEHLNSPTLRAQFHEAQFTKQHELPNGDVTEAGQYVVPGMNRLSDKQHFDNVLKDAHRNLLAAGEVANENWLRHGHTNSEYLNLPPERNPNTIKKSEDVDSDTIDHMHGYSHSLQLVCQAARFLSGQPTDEVAFRNALRQQEGDLALAALVSHGLNPTPENLKALHAITKIQDLEKALAEVEYEIKAAHPEGEIAAKAIQDAIAAGHVQKVKLGGKHSSGSLLVRCEEENWLIKPGDSKGSPAAGVNQETASQSEREVAYWHIAEALGMGHIVPRAELIWLNEKQAAAIHMLPFAWKNLDAVKKEEPNIGRIALEPYRLSGDIFKWAILDYVLSNVDRHGMNLMISDKDDGYKVALIDHGSAFAGDQFSPGKDTDTWIPYYLRVWSHNGKWDKLTGKEKLQALPRAPADKEQEVFHWLLGINPERIGAIMQRYGINAQPHLANLAKLKACKEPIDLYIGKLWCGL